MAARGYLSMALDSAREAGDPYLSVATLGHMSFVPADAGGFTAAVNLRATAMEERRPVAAADAKLAVQGDRGGAAERQGPLPAALAEHQHDVQVEGKIGHPEAGLPAASGTDVEHGHDRDGLVGHDGWLQARHRVDGDLFLVLQRSSAWSCWSRVAAVAGDQRPSRLAMNASRSARVASVSCRPWGWRKAVNWRGVVGVAGLEPVTSSL
jgi:hypothetical protein